MTDRIQTPAEEWANSLSHGLGFLAALALAPILIVQARGATAVVGASVFAATMVLLYAASTLYHALPAGRAKRVFTTLDHSAIYLFIAGSYTPFALGALSGPWGWTLFGLVWFMALAGVVLKSVRLLDHAWLSTGLYLAMGWLVLVAAVPLIQRVATPGLWLLVAGGLAYSLGVVFFALDSRIRFAHAVWHGFVLLGTGLHVSAVLGYAGGSV